MQKIKLLIIEDDADQRDLIRETLEDHFGTGTVVAVGSRTAAMAEDLGLFDLILTDYNLPDSSGMELLDDVKKRCTTPVIMVTGENVGHIAIEAIKRGATDYVVKIGDYLFTIPLVIEKNLTIAKVKRENETLRIELERALNEVRDKNVQLEQSLLRVEELAATDPLTGLYNRRYFNKVLDQQFAEAGRCNHDLSCVMVDMDHFKQMNDTLGHQIGDQLLITAAKVIGANMRRMDVAARFGGDEFVLLLPHASAEEAAAAATRIREEYRIASANVLGRAASNGLSMSVGVASLIIARSATAEQLIAAADGALYSAKAAGRDRTVSATGPLQQAPAAPPAPVPTAVTAVTSVPAAPPLKKPAPPKPFVFGDRQSPEDMVAAMTFSAPRRSLFAK